MTKRRILYISHEIKPYFLESVIAQAALDFPKKMNAKGHEIRVFMPRFGSINERRHQLHEVIRLSGINVVINDMDMPLIIKVASVPGAKIQVYFIDNEDYFKRKGTWVDKEGKAYPDNGERSLFFAKSVFETIKKLGWKPDVMHMMGWMGAAIPAYKEQFNNNDPHFKDVKTVYSVFNDSFEGKMDDGMTRGMTFDKLDVVSDFAEGTADAWYAAGCKHSQHVLRMEDLSDSRVKALETAGVTMEDGTGFVESPADLLDYYETLFD